MSTISTPRRAARLAEKAVLSFVTGAAAVIGAIEIVLLAIRVVRVLSGAATTVSIPLAGAPTEAALAEAGRSGPAPSGAVLSDPLLSDPRVTAASYDSVSLALSTVPESARGMLVLSDVLAALIPVGICAVLVWLCLRVFVGRPFVRSVTWSIGLVSILVVAGGLGGAAGRAVAHAQIAEALDLAGSGLPAFLAEVPLAPIGWAVALAVVAGAFEIGQRMQRETEGLV